MGSGCSKGGGGGGGASHGDAPPVMENMSAGDSTGLVDKGVWS